MSPKSSARSRIEYADHEELKDKPAGYVFPNFLEPIYVLDMNDDLAEDAYLVLCLRTKSRIFTWRGPHFSDEGYDIVRPILN